MEGRTNDFIDMVSARRREEQGFRFRTPFIVRTIEQELSDGLGTPTSAGFAGRDDVDASRNQRIGQTLELGRFADAFRAF